jgi:hypothetical protein
MEENNHEAQIIKEFRRLNIDSMVTTQEFRRLNIDSMVTAPSESRHDFLEHMWPIGSSEEKETDTSRPQARSSARTERPRGGSDELEEITHTPANRERTEVPVNGRSANLSTPIANLLTDLRTMHDDM